MQLRVVTKQNKDYTDVYHSINMILLKTFTTALRLSTHKKEHIIDFNNVKILKESNTFKCRFLKMCHMLTNNNSMNFKTRCRKPEYYLSILIYFLKNLLKRN